MRLLFYVFGNSKCGWGHWVRSIALAQTAVECGHTVYACTDKEPPSTLIYHYAALPGYEADFVYALNQASPDWVVVDLQGEVPEWIYTYTADVNLCLIDGIGQPEREGMLVISQGLEGEYPAPDYLILRPEITRFPYANPRTKRWFVFGGGADKMKLRRTFQTALPTESAVIISTDIAAAHYRFNSRHVSIENPDDLFLFDLMTCSEKACVAMGMTVWELLYFEVKPYVFSISERHLTSALQMQEQGWIKAWPEVGLPRLRQVRQFLEEPFEGNSAPLDGQGARRVLELMEQS